MPDRVEDMSLSELLALAGGEVEPPCELAPFMRGVEIYASQPGDPQGFLGQWSGDAGVSGSELKVMAVRTSALPSPVTALIVDLRLGFDAGQLPLVQFPPGSLNLSHVQVLYLSRILDDNDVRTLNIAITAFGSTDPLQLPLPSVTGETVFFNGFSGALYYGVLGAEQPALQFWPAKGSTWELPPQTASTEVERSGPAPGSTPPPANAQDPQTSPQNPRAPQTPQTLPTPENVGRTVDLVAGHVRVARIGGALAGCSLKITADVTLTLGPLEIQVYGLGLSVTLDGTATVRPEIAGAGISFRPDVVPPVQLAGALAVLAMEGMETALAGSLALEIPTLVALRAAVFWGRSNEGWASFFGYGELMTGTALGVGGGFFAVGPVSVTGLSLGFGINSSVRLPVAADVGRFPLVQRLGESEGVEQTPLQALNALASWITPAQGQYWVAGGLQFTVFGFIDTRALILVEFGQAGWKALLAGKTTVTMPKTVPAGKNPIAKAIIDFAISYDSALGRFAMDVVLGRGSYVVDERFTLTGGVSLYVWSKDLAARGIRKGFVLTIGGYHPQFEAPAYFPVPPRVGAKLAEGAITFTFQHYLAVTDGAFMVGGALAAVYDKGGSISLRAWFTARFDALVQWKPFYLDLGVSLSIGVSASVKVAFIRVKVSLEVGVTLQLWTPPLGGRVTIKVWFVSFTIGFGADRTGSPPVPWSDFVLQVPAPVRTALRQGVELKDVTAAESEARRAAEEPELVRIDGFSVAVESALPASKITVGGSTLAGDDAARVDIRPMRLTGVVSVQEIRLAGPDGDLSLEAWRELGWRFEATRDGLPRALWGRPLADPKQALRDEGLVPDCLTGAVISVPAPVLGASLGPVPAPHLSVEANLPDGLMPLADRSVAGTAPVPSRDSVRVIGETLLATAAGRTAVHRALSALGAVAPDCDGSLEEYAALAGRTMTDFPYLTATGAR